MMNITENQRESIGSWIENRTKMLISLSGFLHTVAKLC